MGPSDRAAHAQLSPRHRDWLASLPPVLHIETDTLLCHGSPGDDLEYLLEDVRTDGVYPASHETIQRRLGSVSAKLILCGHTHIPRSVHLASGVHVVNPGSVGLPAYDDSHPFVHYMETGSPHARYMLLDRASAGWRVMPIALEYDWIAASDEARRAHRPDWAHALATGHALKPE
jgi:hypothetical protein